MTFETNNRNACYVLTAIGSEVFIHPNKVIDLAIKKKAVCR